MTCRCKPLGSDGWQWHYDPADCPVHSPRGCPECQVMFLKQTVIDEDEPIEYCPDGACGYWDYI